VPNQPAREFVRDGGRIEGVAFGSGYDFPSLVLAVLNRRAHLGNLRQVVDASLISDASGRLDRCDSGLLRDYVAALDPVRVGNLRQAAPIYGSHETASVKSTPQLCMSVIDSLSEQEPCLKQATDAGVTKDIAFVYGAPAGIGGLGIQSANAAVALASCATDLHAFGPGHSDRWPLSLASNNIYWHEPSPQSSSWSARHTWRRWYQGRLQFEHDASLGRWAAEKTRKLHPQQCYVFTQVGLEVLRWAKETGVPSVLECPNGHIRNFREVYEVEAARWCGAKFRGHPSPEMVDRVEEEYELADRIRVSSEWSKDSIIARGVPASKIHVLQQPVDLNLYRPSERPRSVNGPLRICFVGSLDLRKGFVYLLRALRLIGSEKVSLEIVGATGSRCCARLFAKESRGLAVTSAPGDPRPAYHRAEVFVLPTLEDGSPFAVAEAMACGLPVIVTDSCGSAEWITQGHNGWVVPARQPEAIAEALETALRRREDLKSMGDRARADTERRAGPSCFSTFHEWLFEG